VDAGLVGNDDVEIGDARPANETRAPVERRFAGVTKIGLPP
jgi:hypothetical protein